MHPSAPIVPQRGAPYGRPEAAQLRAMQQWNNNHNNNHKNNNKNSKNKNHMPRNVMNVLQRGGAPPRPPPPGGREVVGTFTPPSVRALP